MERMLLLWDELDDLVGVSRCLLSRAVMRLNPPSHRVDGIATLLLAGALVAAQGSLLQFL
ncbi:MAG: hypothetical protein WDM77_09325 [Steroidobacteraceae bacterium]